MMRLQISKGGGALASTLQAILHGAGVTPQSEAPLKDINGYISNKTLAAVSDLSVRLNQALTERERLAHLQKTANTNRKTSHAKLERSIRDAWAVIKRRTRRESQPETLLSLYGMSDTGRYPANQRANLWLDYARQVIEAEGTAVAEGYQPLANPSAADLAALSAQVIAAREAEAGTIKNLLDQRKAAGQLVREVRLLVTRVFAEIRLALRGQDDIYVRNVIRAYGGYFLVEAGETEEPEEGGETETPPADEGGNPDETEGETPDDTPTGTEGGEPTEAA